MHAHKRQTMRNVKPQFTSLPRSSVPARYSLHSAYNRWLHNSLFSSTAVPHSPRGDERSDNSVVFLQNILERAVHRTDVKQEPTRRISKRQQGLDDEWSRQLRLLYKNMDVSSAVLTCSKLPLNRSKKGFDILINVLIEKGGEYGTADLYHHGELEDKSFELLQQMKAKGFAPSEITCRKLLKSIFDKGDMVRFKNILHWVNEQEILGPHTTRDIPQGENPQDETTDNAEYNNIVVNHCQRVLDGVEISKISCKGRLKGIFQCLGKLGYLKMSEDYFVQLHSEGRSVEVLLDLIDSFVKGLTQTCQRSRDIKRDVACFKNIINLLELSTIASFDILIGHCVAHGEIDLCIDLIQTMEKHGLEPSTNTFEPLIIFFARVLDMSKAEDILQAMRSNNIEATMKSYKHMILAYTKSDDIEKAYNLLESISIPKLTADLYSPIIHAYGIKGQLRQALGVFKQMQLKELNPTADNFSNLILAFAFRREIENAELVFQLSQKHKYFTSEDCKVLKAAMIRGYGICNNSQKLEKMIHDNDAGLLNVKSALLSGYANSGNIHEAIGIYDDIRWINCWPDAGTFFSFLTALGNAGDFEKLFSMFGSFKDSIKNKSRVSQAELTCIACCHVFYPLIYNNKLDKALEFLELAQKECIGDVETLCSLVFTIEGKIAEQGINLTLDDKLKFLEAMNERLKVQPTRILYEYMLESCAREKDMNVADRILQMMRLQNLEFNIFTFLIYLRIAVSQGDPLKVQNVVIGMKTMDCHGLRDHDVKEMITQILKGRKLSEDGQIVQKLLQILYPVHCHANHAAN